MAISSFQSKPKNSEITQPSLIVSGREKNTSYIPFSNLYIGADKTESNQTFPGISNTIKLALLFFAGSFFFTSISNQFFPQKIGKEMISEETNKLLKTIITIKPWVQPEKMKEAKDFIFYPLWLISCCLGALQAKMNAK